MKIELLGWKSEGLRCADLDFDFQVKNGPSGAPPKAVLVQMPNGTGKTTTLNCIRAALTGEAEKWGPDLVKLFASRDGQANEGAFDLRLRIDGTLVTIRICFDFSQGQAMYTTTFERGMVERFDPPLAARRFLSEHFVKLLVFDGELPGDLLDAHKTKAQDAIEAFFQLYLLQDMKNAIQRVFDAATSGKPTEKRGLTRHINLVDTARKKVKKLESTAQELSLHIKQLALRLEEINSELERIEGVDLELKTRKDKLLAELSAARIEQNGAAQELMIATREPARLANDFRDRLESLRENLDRLKLPESTSRQFFLELAEQSTCICGRPIDAAVRDRIITGAEQYLGADMFGAVNHIKHQIDKYVGLAKEAHPVSQLKHRLVEAGHTVGRIESALEVVDRQIVESGGTRAQGLSDERSDHSKTLSDLQELLDEIERDALPEDGEQSPCLKYWKQELRTRERKLAEVKGTVSLREDKDVVCEILDSIYSDANSRINSSIVQDMNSQLDVLLPGHRIQVQAVDQCIRLKGQAGASLGQTLAVGYAFLATLFKRSGHQLPFIVDAPVTALDGRVRREIGQVLPHVCPQFVGLVLDTEREDFAAHLEAAANGDVLYLTAFDDGPRNSGLLDQLPATGVSRCGSGGVVVSGREYFMTVSFPTRSNGE